MKAVNIIIIVLQMENGCMNEYTCKSTTRCYRITTRWVRDAITSANSRTLHQTRTNNHIMSLRLILEWSTSLQHHEDCYHTTVNGKHCIFISIHSSTRVSPFLQELMKLLTHEGSQHHNDCIANGKWVYE